MNELITVCIESKDLDSLLEFPQGLMNDFEKEVLTWIFKYVKEFGAIPTVSRLTTKFPYFVPIRGEEAIPVKDLAEQTVKRKRKEFVLSKMSEIESTMREADDVPLDKLVEMMMTIGGSTGLTRYSTFDRERYFRSGNLKIGIPIIDRVTGGVAKGEFMIVAGRLGTGKSTTVQWIMKRWWEDNKKILLISKEMLPVDVFSRIDGMVGRFNPLRIRTDHKEDVMPMLRVVTGIVSSRKGEIYVPSQQVASPAQIGALAQNLEIDAIVIDGLYLLRPDGAYSQKWEKVAAISNAVKQMALDLQLPIIGTTQIKRVGAKDEFDPEDLAYSDALGQDADFVVALSPSKAVKSRIEAQLIKTRYGPNVASVLYIDWDSMNIVDESTEGAFESRSEGF